MASTVVEFVTVRSVVAGCSALVSVLLALSVNANPYVPQGPFVVPAPGGGIVGPTMVGGKELSTHTPGTFGTGGDRNVLTALDPEQNLNWDGVGGTADGADYSGSRVGSTPNDDQDREVDSLAHASDLLYDSVIANTSALLFSVDDDSNIYFESIGGAGGVWADQALS